MSNYKKYKHKLKDLLEKYELKKFTLNCIIFIIVIHVSACVGDFMRKKMEYNIRKEIKCGENK